MDQEKIARLRDQSRKLTEEINGLCEERLRVDNQIAEAQSPFKIGDRIRHKRNLAQFHVTSIVPQGFVSFRVHAAAVLKGGELGVRAHKIDPFMLDLYELVPAEEQVQGSDASA